MAKVRYTGAGESYIPSLELVAQHGETVEVPADVAESLAGRPDWERVGGGKKASTTDEVREVKDGDSGEGGDSAAGDGGGN